MKPLAIVLIVVGIIMLIFRGFNFTREKKVVDLGPLQVNKKENKRVSWPLYAGGIAVAAGVIVLLAGKKNA